MIICALLLLPASAAATTHGTRLADTRPPRWLIRRGGDIEIAAGLARLDHITGWVFEHYGNIQAGWHQLSGEGLATGFYNGNTGAGDIGGDGLPELIVSLGDHDLLTRQMALTSGRERYRGHIGHDMDGNEYVNVLDCCAILQAVVDQFG